MNQQPGSDPEVGSGSPPDRRPKLCDSGHAVVITRSYTQASAGSAVVMRNLLKPFDPSSYSLVVSDFRLGATADVEPGVHTHVVRVSRPEFLPKRSENLWQRFTHPLMTATATRIVRSLQPKVIVAVYPHLQFLSFARESARSLRVPWLVYLHDTIVEAGSSLPRPEWAAQLQQQTFAEASTVLVTSRAMADLYERKYAMKTTPIEISYLEPIPSTLPEARAERRVFIGGTPYAINTRGLLRVQQALSGTGIPLVMATPASREALEAKGFTEVQTELHGQRSVYLDVLTRQGVLLVVLDWPEETSMHEEELASAFPTKAVEYLASGRPILIHCPKHYFLARFFEEHHCGTVVSERSPEALRHAITTLLEGGPEVDAMRRSALEAAQIYSIHRLAPIFKSRVDAVAQLAWGEKLQL